MYFSSQGPNEWNEVSKFCEQSKQSPINIITCEAEFDSKLKTFKFIGYDKENEFTIKNNGHSGKFCPNDKSSTLHYIFRFILGSKQFHIVVQLLIKDSFYKPSLPLK